MRCTWSSIRIKLSTEEEYWSTVPFCRPGLPDINFGVRQGGWTKEKKHSLLPKHLILPSPRNPCRPPASLLQFADTQVSNGGQIALRHGRRRVRISRRRVSRRSSFALASIRAGGKANPPCRPSPAAGLSPEAGGPKWWRTSPRRGATASPPRAASRIDRSIDLMAPRTRRPLPSPSPAAAADALLPPPPPPPPPPRRRSRREAARHGGRGGEARAKKNVTNAEAEEEWPRDGRVAFYNGLTLVACRFAPVAFYAHLFFFCYLKRKRRCWLLNGHIERFPARLSFLLFFFLSPVMIFERSQRCLYLWNWLFSVCD